MMKAMEEQMKKQNEELAQLQGQLFQQGAELTTAQKLIHESGVKQARLTLKLQSSRCMHAHARA